MPDRPDQLALDPLNMTSESSSPNQNDQTISVIIPAYNEVACLPSTLAAVMAAAETLAASHGVNVEILVVANNSTDSTAAIALAKGARVVPELTQGIAYSRNSGARQAKGDVLVFIDADVIIPPGLLEEIHVAMTDPACVGGGVDVTCRPRRLIVRVYLRAWRLLGRALGMVQGATQFCRRSAFDEIGGYDETKWIGEDVDFYWALKRLAKRKGGSARLIRASGVLASSRRFDHWPVWKTLLFTNPLHQPALHSLASPEKECLGRVVLQSSQVTLSPQAAAAAPSAPAWPRPWAAPAGRRPPWTQSPGPPGRRRRSAFRR